VAASLQDLRNRLQACAELVYVESGSAIEHDLLTSIRGGRAALAKVYGKYRQRAALGRLPGPRCQWNET
jgi:hypothetical protein